MTANYSISSNKQKIDLHKTVQMTYLPIPFKTAKFLIFARPYYGPVLPNTQPFESHPYVASLHLSVLIDFAS